MDAHAEPHCPSCFSATTAKPCPTCGWQPGAENPPPALALGTRLDGRYRLGRVLGHGGFGITYLVWDENLQLRLAIKEYLPRDSASRAPDGVSLAVYSGPAAEQFAYGLERFLEEARALARFDQHPGIVTVKSFFRAHGTGYSVMDYVEGLTLKQYLEQQPGGRLPFDQALRLLLPILDALRAVHQEGLLHRDIAPDNIYVSANGRIKLLDFGAARFAAGEHSKSLSVILKPGYAPEEQYRTKGKQGPWTDVYSLAATLYRAVTGILPPEALDRVELDELIPPSRLGIAITPAQEAVLFKALAVRAGERYPSVAALQEAWREAETPAQPTEQPMPAPSSVSQAKAAADQSSSPVKPRSRMLTAVLFIALLAMLGFGMIVLIPPPLEPTLPPLAVQPPPVAHPEPQSSLMSESDGRADQLAERQRQQRGEQNRLAEQKAARGREIAALEQRFNAHLASNALTMSPDGEYALRVLQQVLDKVEPDERWPWNGEERDSHGIENDARRRIVDRFLTKIDVSIENGDVEEAEKFIEVLYRLNIENEQVDLRKKKLKNLKLKKEDYKKKAVATIKALEDQLRCIKPPDPAKAIRIMLRNGFIKHSVWHDDELAQTPFSPDGIPVFEPTIDMKVYGQKVMYISGWARDKDGEARYPFARGPGTAPSVFISILLDASIDDVSYTPVKIRNNDGKIIARSTIHSSSDYGMWPRSEKGKVEIECENTTDLYVY
ncbi:serine/threonine protein kinase [Thiocystis violascens]|uniref:Serine/threonine protein kinase n=1 Tax=Thiocystis violascens (strain ATCC 17096 / DSM 198 / 6111) TaxID=765911 RepID=I3YAI7_THIV6|nr:serine/threonine-protein kinase [Thiocystis violascens]AFL74005.1 serine/threonine protein kinase [Thiocystis violascens DSM 198]